MFVTSVTTVQLAIATVLRKYAFVVVAMKGITLAGNAKRLVSTILTFGDGIAIHCFLVALAIASELV